jgi:cytochrome c oxidase assembly protein subunit 15
MAGLFAVVAGKFETKGLAIPSFGLGFGIILQAVVGGISVLTQLNFLIVGLHFLISIVLIAIASLLVFRARPKPAGLISGKARALSVPVAVVSILAIVLGVLVTGAGPHAGDAATPRNGLDLELWQHYHSYPGYLMLVLISLQWFLQITASKSLLGNLASRILTLLLVATLLQAIVGVAQARWGVPPFLVGLHILGAAALSSLITFQFLVLRKAG